MFVRGYSAFLRARTETWRASLLPGGGKKEGSKGGGKRELLHLSRWQTCGKDLEWKRKGGETPAQVALALSLAEQLWSTGFANS